jgi:hypothetical protein
MGEHDNLTGIFRDSLFIAEFRDDYPEVPVYKDVDLLQLTGGEPNPVFVTLPIGKANVKSGNRKYYDEAFLQELEKQVRNNKPIGLMGHLDTNQRSFSFPAEAVHWIGSLRIKEFLFGKGFLPPGESRSRLQRYKATSKKIATSIDATGDGIWDEKIDAFRMIADTLVLNQIDIAPSDRAGIADLSAVPLLTREMLLDNGILVVRPIIEEKTMSKEEVIRELKSSDASLLPDEIRMAILQEYTKSINEALGFKDGDLLSNAKKVREQEATREKQVVSGYIKEMATTGAKAVKLESIREMVIDMVEVRDPKTKEEADRFYAEVLEKDSVKKALQGALQETMGPSQTTPIPGQKAAPAVASPMKGNWFVLPKVK